MKERLLTVVRNLVDWLHRWSGSLLERLKLRPEDFTAPALSPLTPKFELSKHGVYFDAIQKALKQDNVHNIALSGSYGSGKSSVLDRIASTHKRRVVQVSLSTLGFADDAEGSPDKAEKDEEAAESSSIAGSKTNRIQKEIVKQLLYREDPGKMPGSRYRRTSGFKFWPNLGVAALVALVASVVFYLAGWSKQIGDVGKPIFDPGLYVHPIVFTVVVLGTLATLRLLHGHIRVEKITAGKTTVALSQNSDTYFDEYLDEIVYFFEVTKRNIVIFEDIDRFDDPRIFETLRSLNILLNGAAQLKKRPIRFVYAIKDSIFDELGNRGAQEAIEGAPPADPVVAELARANRTKFFDLVVPVVPFVTHRSARDLVKRELASLGRHSVSDELIDLTARYIADMRLIKNICNEFAIFRKTVLSEENSKLELSEDSLFAMMLYKSTHLTDFEQIRVGKSKLDTVYNASRKLVDQNNTRLNVEALETRIKLRKLDSITSRSKELGNKLLDHVGLLVRAAAGTRHASRPLSLAGKNIADSDLQNAEFWQEFLTVESPLLVPFAFAYNQQHSFRISLEDAEQALDTSLSLADWNEVDRRDLESKLHHNESERAFLRQSDMNDLMTRDDLSVTCDSEVSSLREYANTQLGSELAVLLVQTGYIDRNFALYTSTYYGDKVSIAARNFMMRCVERNVMDSTFELTATDVQAVIRDYGRSVLTGRGLYNISVLDYLLESGDEGTTRLLKSLVKYGEDERLFLSHYLAEGKQLSRMVEQMVKLWPRMLAVLVDAEEIDDAVRAQLISIALGSMNTKLSYVTSDEIKKYIEDHYVDLDIFTADTTSEGVAVTIVDLLGAMSARLKLLEPLGTAMKSAIVGHGLYQVSRDNLIEALGGAEKLALDEIRTKNSDVYDHVLRNLQDYLIAVITPIQSSVASSENFAAIIEDVLAHHASLVSDVVQASAKGCQIENLGDTSEAAWPALAENLRFPATFANISAYVASEAGVDEDLAKLLTSAGSIQVTDDTDENAKERLAVSLIASREVMPDPVMRTKLVSSLELTGHIAGLEIEPEDGELIGRLIEADLIEDNAESFALAPEGDWSTREFAISKSGNFETYMTPTQVLSSDISPLLRSPVISETVKDVILTRWEEFIPADIDTSILTDIARYAVENEKVLSIENVKLLADRHIDPVLVLPLLHHVLVDMTLDTLSPILKALGGHYALVSEPGWKKPRLPNTEADLKLVERLDELGVISTTDVKGDDIVINLRRP